MADAFHGHHLHVSKGQLKEPEARVGASGAGEGGRDCASEGIGFGWGWRKLILRLFPPFALPPEELGWGSLGGKSGERRWWWGLQCFRRRHSQGKGDYVLLTCRAEGCLLGLYDFSA